MFLSWEGKKGVPVLEKEGETGPSLSLFLQRNGKSLSLVEKRTRKGHWLLFRNGTEGPSMFRMEGASLVSGREKEVVFLVETGRGFVSLFDDGRHRTFYSVSLSQNIGM